VVVIKQSPVKNAIENSMALIALGWWIARGSLRWIDHAGYENL
jgi:hypothetical protein